MRTEHTLTEGWLIRQIDGDDPDVAAYDAVEVRFRACTDRMAGRLLSMTTK